jgi:hypothetical protein
MKVSNDMTMGYNRTDKTMNRVKIGVLIGKLSEEVKLRWQLRFIKIGV